ncbi:ubinuclein-2-like isoform X1 [Coregonus clupeaformis]|uniref:ubinuclein-2-like isoform X1 n=1 Tax=Coregonus clupeaformis TaxID=59861 RepID=UPI001E1C8974|nr:ubinuclein-2-like isoform X1 [Coregonus clupeaformis]
MAEPRKVQFVTLSAFAAGSATETRKRRLEDDEADIDLDADGEVDKTASRADGGGGFFGKTSDKYNAEGKRITVRLNLSLSEPSDQSSNEFNYSELVQNIQVKKNPPPAPTQTPTLFIVPPALDPSDPFNDDERERLQVEALAKKFENKYGNENAAGKKKRKDRMQDLIDIGFGYDETDPFIDNSEAYDELVPASLTTKLGGFYINTGTLQFRAASESEGEDGGKDVKPRQKLKDGEEQVIKRRRKEGNNLEEKKPRKNRVPKPGVSSLMNIHRPEKKKRKKLMKDSLCLAAMLRRFTREKQEMRKMNPNAPHPGMGSSLANAPRANQLLANSHQHANTANNDVSLAELTADPAMMSLLGSANEKELQDLLGDLDFSLLDCSANPHVATPGRENGLTGIGVSGPKTIGGGLGRGLGVSGGLLHPPPLPDGLPPPLIKRIEDLRAASRQFDQEGRKKFFTLDMNNILLDIELQVQEQPMGLRGEVYSHLEAFVPCNKEALLKRLKKLSINIQDDRLRTPLLKLKLAVCSVMPEQIQRYNMDCMVKAANRQQPGEVEKNGSEEEDEGKPGKRMIGPRKKFVWDDKLRSLLCNLVRVKLSCYELESSQCSLSVEDYLKAFMENEVKPLWPKGWMQARMLFKESRAVHSHLTGNMVKKRMVPTPRAKAKEGQWIQQRPNLPTATTPSLPHVPSTPSVIQARRTSSSPSEPICLSDSLDEDLRAPSLDSVSHALTFLSQAAKGLGPHGSVTDLTLTSPLSPPPLQIPNSSPPSITPHYSPSSSLLTSHSLSKVNANSSTMVTMSSMANIMTTLSTSPSTSTASSARMQLAGATLVSRGADGVYGVMKGAGSMGQTQRHNVSMATATHRQGGMTGGSKLHPPSSPSLPTKQRPPPTSSPLLPPHQKVALGMGVAIPGLGKSCVKTNSSSNGGAMMSNMPSSSPQSRATNSHSHPQQLISKSPQQLNSKSPQQLNSKSPQQPSYLTSTVGSSPSQSPSHHQGKSKPHHQSNFITPMQATLTKSSHSNNSSPIIKLTPRPPAPHPSPPAPTPPPTSSPSPSSSSSNLLSHSQMISSPLQYQSPKTAGFRPTYSVQGGGQVKSGQGSYSFAGSQKAPSVISSSSVSSVSSNSSPMRMSPVTSRPDNSPSPSGMVSTSHGQRQRAVGGAKAVGSRAPTATMATPSITSHLTQVSAGSPLLGGPLGFGMLGGLVPVSLPFQFPSLLNFTPPGAPGGSGLGTGANSGYSLSQSDLMDLYKSLQSGSQAALPPHLQLAFSDANQSQGGDMKRKSH